jgi:predicted RNA-binding Zn ribbon-like protein
MPRYDLPKAAPEPLRLVQKFVNTIDLEHEREWLAGWLEEQGVEPDDEALDHARVLREAVRELLYANNGFRAEGHPIAVLDETAGAAALTVDFVRRRLVPRATGIDGALGLVVATVFTAMADGTWPRLKCCRNHGCRWAFYDYSKNRSARWCSMELCGNRTKMRTYRRRRAAAA